MSSHNNPAMERALQPGPVRTAGALGNREMAPTMSAVMLAEELNIQLIDVQMAIANGSPANELSLEPLQSLQAEYVHVLDRTRSGMMMPEDNAYIAQQQDAIRTLPTLTALDAATNLFQYYRQQALSTIANPRNYQSRKPVFEQAVAYLKIIKKESGWSDDAFESEKNRLQKEIYPEQRSKPTRRFRRTIGKVAHALSNDLLEERALRKDVKKNAIAYKSVQFPLIDVHQVAEQVFPDRSARRRRVIGAAAVAGLMLLGAAFGSRIANDRSAETVSGVSINSVHESVLTDIDTKVEPIVTSSQATNMNEVPELPSAAPKELEAAQPVQAAPFVSFTVTHGGPTTYWDSLVQLQTQQHPGATPAAITKLVEQKLAASVDRTGINPYDIQFGDTLYLAN